MMAAWTLWFSRGTGAFYRFQTEADTLEEAAEKGRSEKNYPGYELAAATDASGEHVGIPESLRHPRPIPVRGAKVAADTVTPKTPPKATDTEAELRAQLKSLAEEVQKLKRSEADLRTQLGHMVEDVKRLCKQAEHFTEYCHVHGEHGILRPKLGGGWYPPGRDHGDPHSMHYARKTKWER